jgi:hypothetical protein
MDWDTTKDYVNSFIGAFFLFISIFLIPEIRQNKKYWIPILILTLFLVLLGIDKTNRDNAKEKEGSLKISSLASSYNKLAESYRNDTLRYASFLDSLKIKYGIIRNPISNTPARDQYNTNIEKAHNVHIGPGKE